MASHELDLRIPAPIWDGCLDDGVDHYFDVVSFNEMCDGDCASLPADHHVTWSSNNHAVWSTDFTWQPVDVDIESTVFSQVKWDSDIAQQEMLWNSIDGLEASNLSRLVRVVRDWTNSATEEASSAVESAPCEPAESLDPTESLLFDSNFFTFLHESNHELLERKAGKDLWTWFIDWRDLVLSLAERFETLSGEEVFSLLKTAIAARRSAPRPRAPQQRQAPAERLIRLAKSIVPNAPPFPSQPEALVTGAG